jgi:hypothetical protein
VSRPQVGTRGRIHRTAACTFDPDRDKLSHADSLVRRTARSGT